MSSIKREEEPSSSNDPKNNIEVMWRQFGNLLQQHNARMERLEARMTDIKINKESLILEDKRSVHRPLLKICCNGRESLIVRLKD